MDEMWERAVEVALEGQAGPGVAPRTLTLDGAVKCLHGRLPPPGLLERFQSLQHLSIASVGVSSLEKFPRLRNLQRLILSDNRIAGGLEFLVEAGLDSLRDLDLSNNRIQFVEDLAPLARLHLVSLDLYECPVTRVKDYRSKVFGMIRSLKYLDKMDAEENERPETDDEEEEDEDDEEEEDPGSGEVDGEDRSGKVINGGLRTTERGGVVAVDEDEESDADEEEAEAGGRSEPNGSIRGSHRLSNGFRVTTSSSGHGEAEDSEELEEEVYIEDYEEEEDLGEEIDEEDGGDEAVMQVNEIDDSEEEDGVEEDEEDEEDDEEEEEDVEDEEAGEGPGSTGRLTSREGEIDGHEQGEEDENGGIGEDDEQAVDDDRESDDDDGEDEEDETEYLVQPIGQQAENMGGGSDLDVGNEDGSEEEEEVDDEEDGSHGGVSLRPSPPRLNKRRRDEEDDDDDDLNDDSIEDSRSSKNHR